VGGPRAALRQAVTVPAVVFALFGAWLALLELLPETAVRSAGTKGGLTGPTGALHLLALLAGFLLQGGVEEWLIRGYTYHALRERWRRSVAILASSALFAVLHGLNPDVSAIALINTFLAGVILNLLVERSRSLWSAVLAHGVWNFTISSLVSLPVSGVLFPHLLSVSVQGPPLLTGGGFGPEGSAVLTLLALPLVAALAFRLPPPAPPNVLPKAEIQPEHSAVPS
jgi:membrane protease YdiL (CAAX protease family)